MTLVVISCEHASRSIPPRWQPLFEGKERLLASHRGWDPGALPIARSLARRLAAPLFVGTASRLLVELNRSLRHPQLFSAITRQLSAAERSSILARVYRPFRRRVEAAVDARLAGGSAVVHLSVHTFTPVLDGRPREVDVGWLYDPSRPAERRFCGAARRSLSARCPHLRVRRNAPYSGWTDGHTTALRRRCGERYIGIEIEVSQALAERPGGPRRALSAALAEAIQAGLETRSQGRKERPASRQSARRR